VQNAGFSVYWHSSDQITMRMTSYSIRNCPEDAVTTPPALSAGSSATLKPMLPRREPSKATTLSRILSKASENATGADTCFAAFKVLPVEPARARSGSRTRYTEPADDLAGATACNQVVELMVDVIRRACEDTGNPPVVIDRDVVR
jgi:phosphatidylinositol 4-phosphatase